MDVEIKSGKITLRRGDVVISAEPLAVSVRGIQIPVQLLDRCLEDEEHALALIARLKTDDVPRRYDVEDYVLKIAVKDGVDAANAALDKIAAEAPNGSPKLYRTFDSRTTFLTDGAFTIVFHKVAPDPALPVNFYDSSNLGMDFPADYETLKRGKDAIYKFASENRDLRFGEMETLLEAYLADPVTTAEFLSHYRKVIGTAQHVTRKKILDSFSADHKDGVRELLSYIERAKGRLEFNNGMAVFVEQLESESVDFGDGTLVRVRSTDYYVDTAGAISRVGVDRDRELYLVYRSGDMDRLRSFLHSARITADVVASISAVLGKRHPERVLLLGASDSNEEDS